MYCTPQNTFELYLASVMCCNKTNKNIFKPLSREQFVIFYRLVPLEGVHVPFGTHQLSLTKRHKNRPVKSISSCMPRS